jgi:sec-independent protein translocase protein TatB
MPGFEDSAFLIVLALLLFGPKKLPQLARQAGKLMSDFRRASNEFRTQMEEELRISEQAERQKKVAAIETAAPAAPAIDPYPGIEQPQPSTAPDSDSDSTPHDPYPDPYLVDSPYDPEEPSPAELPPASAAEPEHDPVPIATSGGLSILPPATGLPIPNSAPAAATTAAEPDHPAQARAESNGAVPPTAQPAESPLPPATDSEFETETLHG